MNGERRAAALDAAFAAFLDAYRAGVAEGRRACEAAHRAAEAASITCPACGARSYHPVDKEQGYCARCHEFTSPPGGSPPSPVS